MKNKGIIITIVIVLALVIGIYLYRENTPPAFSIESQDNIKKTGKFRFGKSVHDFDLVSGKSVASRNGWVVTVTSEKGNQVTFELFKNGKYIKDLKTITFQ